MRKKVQEKVPVISLVEERRLELESQNLKAKEEVKGIQDQLRTALKQNSKLRNEIGHYERESTK